MHCMCWTGCSFTTALSRQVLLSASVSRRCRRRRHFVLGEARQHLVSHRKLVDGVSNGYSRLLHIFFDDSLQGVQVGMPGVAVVLDRILAESDAGKTGGIERCAVRASCIPAGGGYGAVHAEVFELFE